MPGVVGTHTPSEILTTSYCQDPSSTDQESSVIYLAPEAWL